MAKGGRQRAEFLAQKQRNRIIGQLNSLHQQGFSDDDIRAAGNNAYRTLSGTNQVTVSDGQTIDQIAAQNNTTVPDILGANPDMTSPKTGMVLNVPTTPLPNVPGGQGSVFAGGLPSNSALGGTTNNPRGINAYRGYTSRNENSMIDPSVFEQPKQGISNPRAPQNWQGVANVSLASAGYTPPKLNGLGQVIGAPATTTREPIAPLLPPQQPVNPGYAQYQYYSPNLFHYQMRTKIEKGYVPSAGELAVLEGMGFIKKNQQPSYAGGGYRGYGGRGGGGRGGGGSRTSRGASEPRLPAFASGQGGFSLVNWRI